MEEPNIKVKVLIPNLYHENADDLKKIEKSKVIDEKNSLDSVS